MVSFLKGAAAFIRAHLSYAADARAANKRLSRRSGGSTQVAQPGTTVSVGGVTGKRPSAKFSESLPETDKPESSTNPCGGGVDGTRKEDAEFYYVTDGSLVEDESNWAVATANAVSTVAVSAAAAAASVASAALQAAEGRPVTAGSGGDNKQGGETGPTKLQQILRRVAGEAAQLCVDGEAKRAVGVYALDHKVGHTD